MATNYTAAEACKILRENTDAEAVRNITGRFPYFALNAVQLNEAGAHLLEVMPDWMTARKVNSFLDPRDKSKDVAEDDEDEEKPEPKKRGRKAKDEDEDEEPKKRGRKAKKPEPEPEDEEVQEACQEVQGQGRR